MSDEPGLQVLYKQLEYLNSQMRETSDTSDSFLGKFVFGGMIAVVSLLNVDLVLLPRMVPSSCASWVLFAAIAVLAFGISWFYFRMVVQHYAEFRTSHRKLKYKYELTLHALLKRASAAEYAIWLEEKVDREPDQSFMDFSDRYPEEPGSFNDVASYFLNHHRLRWSKLAGKGQKGFDRYFLIAMALVSLTIVIRILGLILKALH